MSLTDFIIIGLVALAFIAVSISLIRKKKEAKKAGTCGTCSSCPYANSSTSTCGCCSKADLSKYGIKETQSK